MTLTASVFRLFAAMLAVLTISAMPLKAQDTAPVPDEWQTVVTGQIEAFRHQDAAGALSFAGQMFQAQFKADPRQFYLTVINTGYAPILTSVSHTFGKYELMGTNVVLQHVTLTGADQNLYEATYQLGKEPDGWKVQGVALSKTMAVGV
ncbi:MAG: DUF4864 domain-containing protein [Devosia sp.]